MEGLAAAREWQPIDTAPKDGTQIIAAHTDGFTATVRWDHGAENWLMTWIPLNKDFSIAEKFGGMFYEVMFDDFERPSPTHWMPLPKPPK